MIVQGKASHTRRAAGCSALLAVMALVLPVQVSALDLSEAYRAALAIDPVLAAARHELEAVRQRVPQARSGLLPALVATGSHSRVEGTVENSALPWRPQRPQGYSLALTQPLFRWQAYQAYEQSKLQSAAAETAYTQAHFDLMVRVAAGYFDVLSAQETVTTLRAQSSALQEQLAMARRAFEAGLVTIADQQEIEARAELVHAEEALADNDLLLQRAAFAQLVGREPESLEALATLPRDAKLAVPQPNAPGEWVRSAGEHGLGVQQSAFAAEIARRDVERRRGGYLPTVDLVGSYDTTRNSLMNLFGMPENTWQLGVQIRLPLFQGGAVRAQVLEGVALQARANAELETARRTAEQGARIAFLRVSGGFAQVKALEASVAASEKALASNLAGYQAGLRINSDVLDAQQRLFATRRDLAKARYGVLVNGMRLKMAAANLDEQDLQGISALLVPAAGEQ